MLTQQNARDLILASSYLKNAAKTARMYGVSSALHQLAYNAIRDNTVAQMLEHYGAQFENVRGAGI